VVYHKNNGNRFFLSFEAKYPNPEIKKGKAGCSVGDILSANSDRAASCALFCKSMVTKPLVFESTLSVVSKLLRSCLLELSVVTAFVVSINTIAGGRSSGRNLMDDYLQNKTSTNPDASATPSQRFILIKHYLAT
jgi:hypothetical protein